MPEIDWDNLAVVPGKIWFKSTYIGEFLPDKPKPLPEVTNEHFSKVLAFLYQYAVEWELFGSRSICNPPPMDTDIDLLVLVGPGLDWHDHLGSAGFDEGGSVNHDAGEEEDHFTSFRFGQFNLVITSSRLFYELNLLANAEAKSRNLLNKADRIAMFEFVRKYRRAPHEGEDYTRGQRNE